MKIWRNIVIGLVLLAGIGIFRVPILGAVSALYNTTVRVVSSTGTVLNGTASAVTANYNSTVRIVDSTGHVIDSFGSGGTGTVTSLTPGTGITLTPNPITATGSIALTTPVSSANGGCGGANSCNTVNAQGAIAPAGSVSCDLSLGNNCSFTVASGTVTINVPTNGVVGVQYYLLWSASGGTTVQYATATPGWRIWAYNSASDENPPGSFAAVNGSTEAVGFHYDGTNYRIDAPPNIYGNRIKAAAYTGGTLSVTTVNGTTGTFSGNLITSGGALISPAGGTIPNCSAATGTCVTATGSTNNRGQIQLTGGTAVTTITLTWSGAGVWAHSPFCTFSDGNASITPLGYSAGACGTSTCVIDFAAVTATNINYVCM